MFKPVICKLPTLINKVANSFLLVSEYKFTDDPPDLSPDEPEIVPARFPLRP
jgi:hypothetical protein